MLVKLDQAGVKIKHIWNHHLVFSYIWLVCPVYRHTFWLHHLQTLRKNFLFFFWNGSCPETFLFNPQPKIQYFHPSSCKCLSNYILLPFTRIQLHWQLVLTRYVRGLSQLLRLAMVISPLLTGNPRNGYINHYLTRLMSLSPFYMETRWWFQPIWKICSANWIISPGIGVKIKHIINIFELPPPRKFIGSLDSSPFFHQKLNGTESQRTPFSKLQEFLDAQV